MEDHSRATETVATTAEASKSADFECGSGRTRRFCSVKNRTDHKRKLRVREGRVQGACRVTESAYLGRRHIRRAQPHPSSMASSPAAKPIDVKGLEVRP